MKDKIARWYKQGLWTDKMVSDAVEKGFLSLKDYENIVGKKYT